MSINVADNFSYQGGKPLDARFQFATVADMKAYAEASLYDGCFAYITENKKYYTYDSSNTVDSTTGKWREFEAGGASALSDLTDTNISTPSNGQVLAYNGTSEKWENSEPIGDGNLIQGYYSEGSSISTPQEFLDAVNSQLSGTEITLSPSTLADGINGVFYVVIVTETTARFALGTVENKDAKLTYANNRAYAYSRTISYSTSIAFWGETRTLTSKTTDPQEIGSYYPLTFLNDSNKEALFFVSDNVNIVKNDYSDATTVIPLSSLEGFYLDSAKTQMVTPDVHCIYEDIPTGSLYIWNGSAYIQTSGGAGASSVEDLTDTEIDTETLTDGQILQYNGTDEKWENTDVPADANAYHTDDTAETALDDADYVPFYDSSATAKRKSLWSNIKSVLKTYFDTLYSTVKTKGTPASGGTDLSLVTTGDIYDWNNKANTPTIIAETIAVGSTSVTFSNVPTSGNYLITPFFSVVGLEYDSISQSGSTVTVTFPTQSSIAYAYLKIESV